MVFFLDLFYAYMRGPFQVFLVFRVPAVTDDVSMIEDVSSPILLLFLYC